MRGEPEPEPCPGEGMRRQHRDTRRSGIPPPPGADWRRRGRRAEPARWSHDITAAAAAGPAPAPVPAPVPVPATAMPPLAASAASPP